MEIIFVVLAESLERPLQLHGPREAEEECRQESSQSGKGAELWRWKIHE